MQKIGLDTAENRPQSLPQISQNFKLDIFKEETKVLPPLVVLPASVRGAGDVRPHGPVRRMGYSRLHRDAPDHRPGLRPRVAESGRRHTLKVLS